MRTIDIYCPHYSAKVKYALDFIFDAVDNVGYRLCESISDKNEANTLVNYSNEKLSDCINIPYELSLNDDEAPSFSEYLIIEDGSFNFDFVAAIFYLLSRVEEYKATPLDDHGRYPYTSSILHHKKLLSKPIIDYWVKDFWSSVSDFYSIKLNFSHKFDIVSTVDVDHIYGFKSKGLLVTMGSYLKDILSLNLNRIKDKMKSKDPFDTYDYIHELHRKLDLSCMYFVLSAERTQYDRSLNPTNPEFIKVVKSISRHSTVGIHPSYYSSDRPSLIKKEKQALEKVIVNKIDSSRQHFLRMQLPMTYAYLIKEAIQNDYSMGYADHLGFRSGTSRSYRWYDNEMDRVTNLVIHPFSIMDVTLRRVSGGQPDKAIMIAKELIDSVKAIDGICCVIWHNSSFYDAEGWTSWDNVYEEILRYAKSCLS
jgi:hypothetical protein